MADGFGIHHDSPEEDSQLLRVELSACRSHIEELRLELAEERDRVERLLDALRDVARSTAASKVLRARAQRALREEGYR